MTMKIERAIQGSPEWLALRARHNTASEASAMMGASKNTTRSELLRLKATGASKQYSDWVQKNLLDKGHAIEAAARLIAESIIGDDLYPVTGTVTVQTPKRDHSLLASLDGITELRETVWECKSWNESKAAAVREGRVPEEDYWQVVQQLVVSGADRCLYMVTDGTKENTVHCWAALAPDDQQKLLAGWEHFNRDLEGYTEEPEKPEVVAESVEALPAVLVKVSGQVAVQNNLSTFEKALRHFIADKLITDPQTDQDFADLDLQIKAMKKAEEALAAAEQQMLAQVQEVDDLKRAKDMLADMLRKHRLQSEKLLASQKEKIKLDIRKAAEAKLADYVAELNGKMGGGVSLPPLNADFASAMKNKRTLSSLRDSADTYLAGMKMLADDWAEKIAINLDTLRTIAAGYEFLFRDRQELVLKDDEAVRLIAHQRVGEHKKAEEERQAAERERIRKEEADRIEREQQERQQEEERQKLREQLAREAEEKAKSRQAAAEPAAAPAPGVVTGTDPASGPDETEAVAVTAGKVRKSVKLQSKLDLLKAVIHGQVPDHVLTVDMDALLELCEQRGHTVPGVVWLGGAQ